MSDRDELGKELYDTMRARSRSHGTLVWETERQWGRDKYLTEADTFLNSKFLAARDADMRADALDEAAADIRARGDVGAPDEDGVTIYDYLAKRVRAIRALRDARKLAKGPVPLADSAIPVSEAQKHIGRYITFLFYPGWEEPEEMSGWLHAVTRSDPEDQDHLTWLSISNDRELPAGEDHNSIGGCAASEFWLTEAPLDEATAN